MNGILNRKKKAGISLLCVMALALLAVIGGAHRTLTASDGATYEVAVTYGALSGIPADASLEVSELSGGRYQDYYGRAVAELGRVEDMRAFDVRCLAPDGTEIEPAAPVRMAFRLPGSGEAARRVRVLHFLDRGGVVAPSLPAFADEADGYYALDFQTDSFSVYAVVGTAPAPLRTLSAGDGAAKIMESVISKRYVEFADDIFPAYAFSGLDAPEAQIEETSYDTLAEAIEAAKDGDEIILLSNATGHFSVDKALSLNLGGNTLTVDADADATEGVRVTSGGALTITNGAVVSEKENAISADGGAVTLGAGLTVSGAGTAIDVRNGGSVTIDGANVDASGGESPAASVAGNGFAMEIKSGSLSKTNSKSPAVSVSGGAALTVSGGVLTVSAGESTVSGGEATVSGGETTVSGDAVTSDSSPAIFVTGENSAATVSGGEIHGAYAAEEGKITITGGAFTDAVSGASADNLTASGGVFQKGIDSLYVAAGFNAVLYGDGYAHVGKPLTITASSGDKVYDGTELTLQSHVSDGLMSGDSVDSIEISGSQTDVGESPNVPSNAVIKNGNGEDVTKLYAITYVNGSLTVTPKAVTVTANDASKAYGASDPQLTATVEGLVGDDTVEYTLSRAEGEEIGEHAITASGNAEQGNYLVTFKPGVFTITEKPVTVTITGHSDTVEYDGAEHSVSGYDVSIDNGSYTEADFRFNGDANLTQTDAGTWNMGLSASQFENVNKDFENVVFNVTDGSLTVTPKAVVVAANDASKVYGEANPELSATVTGLIGEDTIAYTLSREAGDGVGTYVITPSGDAAQGNYSVTYETGKLTITGAPVTVKADDISKTYGESDPAFTATVSVEGVEISYTLSRAEGEDVGTYVITPSGDAEQGNYAVTYETGKLTITGAPVTVKADDISKTYGESDPAFTATVSVEGAEISCTFSRAEGDGVGTYVITPSGATEQGNYAVTYQTGTLTIERASVTVKANDVSKVYDATEPELTATVTGLVGDDTVSYTLACETDGDVGEYVITPFGEAEQGNYHVDFAQGLLTIMQKPVKVEITGHSNTANYDGEEHSVSGYDVSIIEDGALYTENDFQFSGSAEAARTDAGTTNMGLDEGQFENRNKNFDVAFTVTDGFQTISPITAVVTITGHNDTVDYDGMRHSVNGYDVSIEGALYAPTDFKFLGGVAEASRTDAGTTNMGLAQSQFENLNPNFTDVAFNVTDGYQTVSPIDVTVTVVGNKDTAEYDGEEHSVSGYTVYASSPLYDVYTDFTFSGPQEAARTNAGVTDLDLKEEQFKNTNGNFGNVYFDVSPGYIEILPIEDVTVTITGHHDTAAYDGAEHSVSGYDAEADSSLYLPTYITFTGTDEAKRTDAGTTPMNLSAGLFVNNSENFSNVVFEVTDGYQTITPISATVTIVGHTGTAPYDGEPHTVKGYDVTCVPDWYTKEDFTLIVSGRDEVTQTEAGISQMNLSPDLFRNVNSNFENVIFNVKQDGWIQVNPAVEISKYLDNPLATEEETFAFRLKLTDYADQPIASHALSDSVMTDENGDAVLTLSVRGGETKSQILSLPLESYLTVTEDTTNDANNYGVSVSVDGETDESATASVYTGTNSKTVITFTNAKTAVCQIGEKQFQTISAAIGYANTLPDPVAVIEMLTDYVMSAADEAVIPAQRSVTLTTAWEYDGDAAVIKRAVGHTGAMFTNNGTLNLGSDEGDRGVILDGNADSVTASAAMIENRGTLNAYAGATLRNANGGAVGNAGSGTVNALGATFRGNAASKGGAIYAADGAVNISAGNLTGNSADNGGAVYMEAGELAVSGGRMDGNSAGNGGAVYAANANVTVSDGVLSGNHADGVGGAIYAKTGVVSVSGGVIGGTADGSANTAVNGSAIFVQSGNANFSGGSITGNAATNGGAVGIGGTNVTLGFSGSPVIIGNTMGASPANVYLDKDSQRIISATGMAEEGAQVGIYVPGDGTLYRNRGVSLACFGVYTSDTGVNGFSNDRTPYMKVTAEYNSLYWGKPLTVEVRYLADFVPDSLPPQNSGDPKGTVALYNPPKIENYVSDIASNIAADITLPQNSVFACAFLEGAASYGECLNMVSWDNHTGNWSATRWDGEIVRNEKGEARDIEKLILYYSLPAYLSIANNTEFKLDISSLTLNDIPAASGYGFVVARNGSTVAHFEPLADSDLELAPRRNIKLMFPGVRNKTYKLDGSLLGATESDTVDYTYDNAKQGTTLETVSEKLTVAEFSVTGNTFNNDKTIAVVFGEATAICKITEWNGEAPTEHLFSSLAEAVNDGAQYYDDYKISVADEEGRTHDTVKIEMLQDYQIPSEDKPDIPIGKNFTFTTAAEYSGGGDEDEGWEGCAKISRDSGNSNSFITVKEGGDGTALTVENLRFDGYQMGSSDGGVINARTCAVTVRHCRFSRLTAGDGGAIYVGKKNGDPCELYVSDSYFEECLSISSDDRKGGGAIWTTAKYFELTNCEFHDCMAWTYDTNLGGTAQGGGVFHRIDSNYNYRAESETIVKNCKFMHCHAHAGGGLEIDSYNVTVAGCTFFDCQAAKRNGGGFNAFLQNSSAIGQLSVSDCSFSNCFAEQRGGGFRTMYQTTVNNCTFTDNMANGDGGGVSLTSAVGSLELNGCIVEGNKSGGKGGGVYAEASVTLRNGTKVIENSLLTDNVQDGAGIYLKDNVILTVGPKNDDDATEADTIIVRENKTLSGSASNLRLSGDNPNKEHCVIIRSNLSGESELRVLNANAKGTKFGQAKNISSPSGMKAFQADNNDLYGAIDRTDASGQEIIWRGAPICKITDGDGNLLFFDTLGADPAVFDYLDNTNTKTKRFAAFAVLRSDWKKADNTQKLYRADGSQYGDDDSENAFCVKMLVEEYRADQYITTNQNNTWQNILLTTAGENDEDGFKYKGNPGTRATIFRESAIGNDSLLTGKVNLRLENIILDGNGVSSKSGTDNGGALLLIKQNANATVTLGENAVLQNGYVEKNGGGVAIQEGILVIDGGIIQDCHANQNGGGVCMNNANAALRLIKGEIRNCSAGGNGGGVWLNNGKSFTMSGGSITENSAGGKGGGVYVAGGKTMYLSVPEGNTASITGNSAGASGAGGGIAVGNGNSMLYFSGDVVVYDNFKGADTKCNVELNYDSETVINAQGLGANALIGVYVPGEPGVASGLYEKRGVAGMIFGSIANNEDGNLFLFVNDRNDLRGWRKDNNPKVCWMEMHTLTVSKKVVSPLSSDSVASFRFKVTLNGSNITQAPVSFGKSEMPFNNGVAEFDLKNGESKTALYLPGMAIPDGYTIEEAEDSGFNVTVKANGGDEQEIPEGGMRGSFKEEKDGKPVIAHTAEFINTRKRGNLTVSKTVVSEESSDLGQEFTFRVIPSPSLAGEYGGMTFENGFATFTLSDKQSVTGENLPTGVSYTVLEIYDSGAFSATAKVNDEPDVSAGNGVSVDLKPGENVTVAFTNTRKTGKLTVTKKVSSDLASDTEIPFHFTVTLTDNTIGKVTEETPDGRAYGEMTFKDGVAEFDLKNGESKVAEGLPLGVSYTVTETEEPGFQTSRTGSRGRLTTSNADIKSVFTNTRLKGSLKIQKVLDSDRSADSYENFKFIVKLGHTDSEGNFVADPINKTYNGVTFENGVASVTVTERSPKTIGNLPQGMDYLVEEEQKDNFENTDKSGDKGTISATLSTAVFTNARKKGNLKISKTVESELPADLVQPFYFTVTLSDKTIGETYGDVVFTKGVSNRIELKNGGSITIPGLPTDVSYIVTETPTPGFTTTKTGDTGVISAAAVSEATFTNTRQKGSLEISKTVKNPLPGDEDIPFAFTVTLNGALISGAYGDLTFTDGVATFELKAGEAKKATGLPAGVRYTVTEATNDAFTPSSSGETGEIKTSGSKAAFTNARKTSSLTVTKEVVSDLSSDAKAYDFTIQLGSINGEGNFVVNESLNAMYSGVSFVSGTAENVQIRSGKRVTLANLPQGFAYKISEKAVSGMSVSVEGAEVQRDADSAYVIGVLDTDSVAVKFTNKRDAGDLLISKRVASDWTEDEGRDFTFNVTLTPNISKICQTVDENGQTDSITFNGGRASFQLRNGGSIRIKDLSVGVSYTVTETRPENFTTAVTNAAGVTANGTGATGAISDGLSAIAFTNTRVTGDLLVVKQVVSDAAADKNDSAFHFTVTLTDAPLNGDYGDMAFQNGVATFDLKHGESKRADGLPTDIRYTVKEERDDGFRTSVDDGTGNQIVMDSADNSVSGNIREGRSTVRFMNERKQGALTVSKTVADGSTADETLDFHFTVKLGTVDGEGKFAIDTTIGNEDEYPDGKAYGDLTFQNGEAKFTLRHGQQITANNLPRGIAYVVEEAPDSKFTTAVADGTGAETAGVSVTGTIGESESVAAFTNTRKTGSLTVRKTVSGESVLSGDENIPFEFTVTLSEAVLSDENGEKTNVTTFTLTDGAYKTITGLPVGVHYTVTETPNDDFTPDSATKKGDISENESTAAFINTRRTTDGSLTVSKTVAEEDALPGDENILFDFTVKLSDPVISGKYGKGENAVTFDESGSTTFKLKHGESKTITGLPVGVHYAVTETPNGDFTPDSATKEDNISADGSAVTFTNTRKKRRKVILRKVAPIDGDSYKSLNGAAFTVYKGNSAEPYVVNGTPLESLTSADNGIFWIGELSYGDYCLKETTVPSGITPNIRDGGCWWYRLTIDDTGVTCSKQLEERPAL